MTKKVPANPLPLEEVHHLKDFNKFLAELKKESDRGAALISVAMLDNLLERTILAFLVDTPEKDRLLSGFNAPLGTFSSRVLAAFSLGLISEREYRECNRLGKIRNEFAHNVQRSFDDQKVKDICATLTFSLRRTRNEPENAKGQYTTAAVALILNLTDRPLYASERRLECTEWQY